MVPTACPHGNHSALTQSHPELRQICAVCGGPRVPASSPTSGTEIPALREAKDAYVRRTSWRFGSGCGAAVTVLGSILGLALLRLDSGVATTFAIGALVATFPFALVLVSGLVKSRGFTRTIAAAIARAWSLALRDVVQRSDRPIHPARLARELGVDETQADRWLAELSVEGVVRSEVTEDGQIVYVPSGRVRVDPALGSADAARVRLETAPTEIDATSAEDAALEARFAELARREAQRKG